MKVFISSTTYDLEEYRKITISLLKKRGHEVIYHESPTMPVKLGLHSHDVCLETIKDVDLVICIIKSRYGGLYKGNNPSQFKDIDIDIKGKTKAGRDKKEKVTIPSKHLSITWCELYIAEKENIDIMTFVKKTTIDEKETRRRNQFLLSFKPAHVEDNKIFDLIDWIIKKRVNNWIAIYNDILDYRKYLIKWIEEIEKNILNPTVSKSNTIIDDTSIKLFYNNNMTAKINKTYNKPAILTFVEGESDRDFLRFIITELGLEYEFKFIVTYGKYRMLQQALDYVISYNSDNVLFIIDYDNNNDEKYAFEKMFNKIDVKNKKIVFAEPNLDEWIKAGLENNITQRKIKKINYEIEFDLKKAISHSKSFDLLVSVLKHLVDPYEQSKTTQHQ
jgi:hypothetical protein